MGHWGYGYKDSDQHLDRTQEYVENLINPLKATIKYAKEGRSSRYEDAHPSLVGFVILTELRSHLMWTFAALEANSENELDEDDYQTLHEGAKLILEQAEGDLGKDWTSPEEMRAEIIKELGELDTWLRDHIETELDSRLMALVKAGK